MCAVALIIERRDGCAGIRRMYASKDVLVDALEDRLLNRRIAQVGITAVDNVVLLGLDMTLARLDGDAVICAVRSGEVIARVKDQQVLVPERELVMARDREQRRVVGTLTHVVMLVEQVVESLSIVHRVLHRIRCTEPVLDVVRHHGAHLRDLALAPLVVLDPTNGTRHIFISSYCLQLEQLVANRLLRLARHLDASIQHALLEREFTHSREHGLSGHLHVSHHFLHDHSVLSNTRRDHIELTVGIDHLLSNSHANALLGVFNQGTNRRMRRLHLELGVASRSASERVLHRCACRACDRIGRLSQAVHHLCRPNRPCRVDQRQDEEEHHVATS